MWRGIPKQTPLPFLRSMTKIRLPRMRSTALHGRFPIRLLAEPAIPLYTNLDSETFPIGTVKELYRLRWGIETSFRELKYALGLSHFHSKKLDFIIQEIFARLIMYNFSMTITLAVVLSNRLKHSYQINFTQAFGICRRFFLDQNVYVEQLISRYLLPIRPNRSDQRRLIKKKFPGFLYRIA